MHAFSLTKLTAQQVLHSGNQLELLFEDYRINGRDAFLSLEALAVLLIPDF